MPSSNNNRRHRRRDYTSVASEDVNVDDDDQEESGNFRDEPMVSSTTENDKKAEKEESDDDEKEDLPLSLIILDSAQKKFPIPCDKTWTVGKFKKRSSRIHKVAPSQQRLIFRGKMLTKDDQTLEENKLDTNDLIVHLFPKPRVVVTATKKTASSEETETIMNHSNNNHHNNSDDGDSGIVDQDDNNGAHIPSIVIDQEEQDRRGQILVLGSVEIAESQNNVKMLSLLLVMICAMRLLALFSIAMGAVDEPATGIHDAVHNHTGDVPHNSIYDSDFNDDSIVQEYELREWETQDWFDLLVSAIGFYVGTLGMKATQENTSQLATEYAIGTIVAGIGWNLWNAFDFYKFYEDQNNNNNHDGGEDPDGEEPLTRDDYITVAFFTIVMPLIVWFFCCIRAFEFRGLIREAEREAAERIRNEYTTQQQNTTSSNSSNSSNSTGDDDDDDEEDNHEIV